jgi:lysophospholipase L1-like esterase
MLFSFLVILLSSIVHILPAQTEPAYWKEVQQLILNDVTNPEPRHQILFAGSSSFTLWKNVQDVFPDKPITNVAFGGSTLLDQIRYFEYVIAPYQPKQVVIYCGENDIAYDSLVNAQEVLQRVTALVNLIRSHFPKTSIAYVSMKPSPSRERFLPVVRDVNTLIEGYLKKVKNTSFINVYDAMLNDDGKPRKELFLDDMLHMNKEGYRIWKELIQPHLK